MSIKEIRSSLNMTQKEFSEYFSIPLKTYQRWEQGITEVPKPMMNMIIRILVLEGKLDEADVKENTVVTFDTEVDIEEMSRVCFIPVTANKGIEVYVHTNDGGNVPHFHVRPTNKSWETCIRYDSAEYFLHGKYTDKLPDNKIAKQLDKALRTVNPNDPYGGTYWQRAIIEWNNNNSGRNISFELEQPDYSKLR